MDTQPMLVKACASEETWIDDVKMIIVVLECGHILVRAPEWALHDYYRCRQCEKLVKGSEVT